MPNQYANKVIFGDQTIIDLTSDTVTASVLRSGYTAHSKSGEPITGTVKTQSGKTITPTRSQQTAVAKSRITTGTVYVAPIPDTYYTMEEAIELMFPVGSIYVSTSSTAPTFGGTWVEVVIPATWGDLEDGNRSYRNGTGTGTLHFWKRTA
jgi:hypothetical protein